MINSKQLVEQVNVIKAKLELYINSVDLKLQEIYEPINAARNQLLKMNESLDNVSSQLQYLETNIIHIESQIEGLNDFQNLNDSYLKNDLLLQKNKISLFLEEITKLLPDPFKQRQNQSTVKGDSHQFDAFYVAFEDKFRGSREDITNRLRIYLPIFKNSVAGTPEFPILDVGCGRGELIELLRESGYIAKGVDINKAKVEQCISRKLEVKESDAITYLQSLKENSLGAITGIHFIEHLPFQTLMKFIEESVRVLRSNGLFICETPNPDNILVGSKNFYLDPSHQNPLPSALVKFMFEKFDLKNVQVINLHPYPSGLRIHGTKLSERFSEYFYGPQDYAIVLRLAG